jgi:tetratricopeptide (TPR) repeat protein
MNLGLAYRGVGKLAEAKATYNKALTVDPNNPDPHFNLAVVVGDFEKNYPGAVDEFRAYIDAGGSERALAEGYIEAVEKEQKLQEKIKKAAEDKKRREEERKKKEDAKAHPPDVPVPAPDGAVPPVVPAPAPAPAPAPEPAPAPAPDNPWGEPK